MTWQLSPMQTNRLHSLGGEVSVEARTEAFPLARRAIPGTWYV